MDILDGTVLPAQVTGILFDMDDTLVDTEKAWFIAKSRLCKKYGAEESANESGIVLEQIVAEAISGVQGVDFAEAKAEYLELLQEELSSAIEPMPGVVEFLDRLAVEAPEIPLAVASNSPSHIVRYVIGELGWESRFKAFIGAQDVEHPKPAPDLYLKAAELAGAEITGCVVFEDSFTGATAAKASGAFLVAVADGAGRIADMQISGFTDPQILAWKPKRAE